jgi:hypothetical protein
MALKWKTHRFRSVEREGPLSCPCVFACHQKYFVNNAQNSPNVNCYTILLKKKKGTGSHIIRCPQNWRQNMYHISVYICSFKINGSNNPGHTHSTPHNNCTPCNGTSWFNMGHQYLLFWEFIYPLWWKYVIRTSVGSTSPAYSPWRYQFRICNFASWSVSNRFIIPGVLYECKCNSFVAFHANDADISICCSTQVCVRACVRVCVRVRVSYKYTWSSNGISSECNHHHHHPPPLANMEMGHLLTHSSVTRLEVSLMVSPGFFCLLVCSVSAISVI